MRKEEEREVWCEVVGKGKEKRRKKPRSKKTRRTNDGACC